MTSTESLLLLVLKDLAEVLWYLPVGVLAGGLFLAGWEAGRKAERKAERKVEREAERGAGKKAEGKTASPASRKWIWFCLIVYITALLELAFFSREPGSRIGLDLELFSTWGKTARSRSYVIENVIMFIPFGMLMPAASERFRKGWRCIGAGFLFSAGLEMMQLLTQRGFFQVDDMAANTLGTALGYGILVLLRAVRRMM